MAGTGPQYVESSAPFPGHDWTHLALAFEQDYAVHLSSTGYLDAGSKDSLDITTDFSCEVTVVLDDLDAPHGLLTLGGSPGAPTDRVPYSLRVEPDGSLVFLFVDDDGDRQSATDRSRRGERPRTAVPDRGGPQGQRGTGPATPHDRHPVDRHHLRGRRHRRREADLLGTRRGQCHGTAAPGSGLRRRRGAR